MFEDTFDILGFFGVLWVSFVLPAIIICVPVWFFGKHRVSWTLLDYSGLIVPFILWVILVRINDLDKSLSNAVVEPFFLGCSIAITSIIRLVIGKHCNKRLIAGMLLVGLCLVAFGLWLFVPGLPE
jgi:hypothetical protein